MSVAPDDRRVFLAQPGYGTVTAGASRAFWRASRLPDAQVVYAYREGSLLAANFNALWCDALNMARQGQRIDYFAMQHADVEPEDWWLDTLIDELEAHGFDILGAAVPIKDSHGLTSLALGRPDGDTWRPLCRLTMTEVYRLPETFTSEDVGHPLLLNTGLWVCRFDEPTCRKLHFTINDRIVVGPDGAYRAQCEPEDWFFSRLCHEIGWRVGATRKIKLTHRGPASFGNADPWGEPFDSAWTDAGVVPDDLPGWRFPADVDGWLSYEEGRALAKLALGKCVLEIGSYCGRSTVCMAQTAESVVAVDTGDGRDTPRPKNTTPELEANLFRFDVAHKVKVFTWALSRHRVDRFRHEYGRFDAVFIDGAHGRKAVESDIICACALLAPDGLIAFHDYRSAAHPDVTAVVDELLSAGGELLSLTGSVAVVRPPAPVPRPLSPGGLTWLRRRSSATANP